MRITGGVLKGQKLATLKGLRLRASSDMLRARLFDILQAQGFALTRLPVLDVFAGSGSLGLECLSRGARLAVFVEQHKGACQLIARNAERLGVGAQCTYLRRDATQLGKRPARLPPFALVLLDPPYRLPIWPQALACLHKGSWLAAQALCVVETGSQDSAALLPAGWDGHWRDFGNTRLGFLRVAEK